MNPEVKTKWLAALRSGEYKQGKGRLLATFSGPTEYQHYCCLGVLCDLHAKETGGEWSPAGAYGGEREYLPSAVCEWSSVGRCGQLADRAVVEINDDGASFSEIADIIEREL